MSKLSKELEELIKATNSVVHRLLVWERNISDLEENIRGIHDTIRENTSIMEKFHDMNKGLSPGGGVETIMDAILYIEDSIRKQFPWISTRIILTANQDENGVYSENPVAQVLTDAIEMMDARNSDGTIKTVVEIKEMERLNRLASLLPLSQGALKRGGLPTKIHVLGTESLFTRKNWESSHFLSSKEISELDPGIFGTPGSALAHPIRGIGKIVFLSNDPNHYSPDQDTLLISQAMENLWMMLAFIGEREENKKDLLTWLLLRRSFEEKALGLFKNAKERGETVSFALIDADFFKKVNDTYWHAAGDLVLKTVAKVLSQQLKTEDIKVRWGGEEFWIFMQAGVEDAGHAIQRAFDVIGKIVFQIDANKIPSISRGNVSADCIPFSITLSAWISGNRDIIMTVNPEEGISQEIPFDELTLQDLTREADAMLYIAKKTWRKRITFKSPDGELMSIFRSIDGELKIESVGE